MNKQFFKLAYSNLKKRKLRSGLTLLGIVISIMVICVLISLSLGLQDAVLKIFQEMGQDKIFIYSTNLMTGSVGSSEFSVEDANIVNKVSGVKESFYASMDFAKVSTIKKTEYMTIMGLPIDDKDSMNLILESFTINVESGSFFRVKENGRIVVGNKIPEIFNVKVGDKLKINNKSFRIIGVLESLGNDMDDKQVYLSYSDANELFKLNNRINILGCQLNNPDDIDIVVDRIESRLDNYRNVNDKNRDYIIQKPEELLQIFNVILTMITTFLVGIGCISVFVGAVGIASTMYTSVLERTKEIGVMKAIGAKKSSINEIFLIESGILGVVGGTIGIILGIIIAKIIGIVVNNSLNTNYLSPSFPAGMIVGLMLFSIGIGLLSGLWPSKNAAQTNIVDALRHE